MLALAAGSSGIAVAQSASDSSPSDKTEAATAKGAKTVRMLFAHADRNKDGQLTRAETKWHLPITYASFDSIDTAKRGWISFEQFVDFTNKRAGLQADDILKIGQWP
ncbi:MAG: hypothetical protein C0505_08860 [Leptothrix sp. (in: Bacteria)]|nr:hypothetical protein [Leptothrix sp. (in: b-proteobacteria)]